MLKSLQVGRGIAALAVAAFHLSILQTQAAYGGVSPFLGVMDRGDLGVDFFFVLSGFIILTAHAGDTDKPWRWVAYAEKRFIRVYPLYWLFTAIMVFSVTMGQGTTPVPQTASDWATTISLLHISAFQTPLHPAWTLFHEIIFYAIFSVLIVNRTIGAMVLAIWGATIAALFFYPPVHNPTFVDNLLGAYNLNFLFGMAAALLYSRIGVRAAVVGGGAALVALGGLLWADKSGHWLIYFRPGYGVLFAVAIAAAVRLELAARTLHLPVLALLGDASYTIYLSHEQVETHLMRILSHLKLDGFMTPAPTFISVLAVTAAIGCVVHLFVEKPMLTWLRSATLFRRGVARLIVRTVGARDVGERSLPVLAGSWVHLYRAPKAAGE
jgi:exopolysaccharide production protein ExoZ